METIATRKWERRGKTYAQVQAERAASRAQHPGTPVGGRAGQMLGGQWALWPFNMLLTQPTTPGGWPPAGMR